MHSIIKAEMVVVFQTFRESMYSIIQHLDQLNYTIKHCQETLYF